MDPGQLNAARGSADGKEWLPQNASPEFMRLLQQEKGITTECRDRCENLLHPDAN